MENLKEEKDMKWKMYADNKPKTSGKYLVCSGSGNISLKYWTDVLEFKRNDGTTYRIGSPNGPRPCDRGKCEELGYDFYTSKGGGSRARNVLYWMELPELPEGLTKLGSSAAYLAEIDRLRKKIAELEGSR